MQDMNLLLQRIPLIILILLEKQFDVILHFPEDYKNSKDEQGDMRNVSVEMCKKVYKEMVKEMDKIASQEDLSKNKIKWNPLSR